MNNKIVIAIIIAIITFVALAYTFHKETSSASEVESPIVIQDERDDIQKLTDNFADAYRELHEAETAHAKTAAILEEKTTAYNEAVEYLETYTR